MFDEITFDIILRSVLYSPTTSYDDERQSKKNLTRGRNKQINTPTSERTTIVLLNCSIDGTENLKY